MVLVTVLSTVQLSINASSIENIGLKWINILVTVAFTGETIVQIVAIGPIQFLKQDFIKLAVVVLAIVSIFVSSCASLKYFKILRVGTLLIVLGETEFLRLQKRSLIMLIQILAYLSFPFMILLLLFSYYGITFYQGKLFTCILFDDRVNPNNIAVVFDCLNEGGSWVPEIFNFQTLSNSLRALVVLATSLFDMDSQLLSTEFLIAFKYVAALAFMSLVTAVVISCYFIQQERDQYGLDTIHNSVTRKILRLKLIVSQTHPFSPIGQGTFLLRVLNSDMFNRAVDLAIVSCVITLCLRWQSDSLAHGHAMYVCEMLIVAFTGLFALEILIKIYALSPLSYFQSKLNSLESIVTALHILGIVTAQLTSLKLDSLTQGFLALRALRLLQLVEERSPMVRVIVKISGRLLLPLILQTLFMIILIIPWSILGTILFSNETLSINLQNFGSLFSTLFSLALDSENEWAEIYRSYSIRHQESDCPNNASLLNSFFIIFILILNTVAVKFFVAVSIQTMSEEISEIDIDRFISNFLLKWKAYDPEGSGMLKVYYLRQLLSDLGAIPNQIDPLIASLNLPALNWLEYYSFHDILDDSIQNLLATDSQIYRETLVMCSDKVDFMISDISMNDRQCHIIALIKANRDKNMQVLIQSKNISWGGGGGGLTSRHQILAEQVVKKFKSLLRGVKLHSASSSTQVKKNHASKLNRKFGINTQKISSGDKKGKMKLNHEELKFYGAFEDRESDTIIQKKGFQKSKSKFQDGEVTIPSARPQSNQESVHITKVQKTQITKKSCKDLEHGPKELSSMSNNFDEFSASSSQRKIDQAREFGGKPSILGCDSGLPRGYRIPTSQTGVNNLLQYPKAVVILASQMSIDDPSNTDHFVNMKAHNEGGGHASSQLNSSSLYDSD